MLTRLKKITIHFIITLTLFLLFSCSKREKINSFSELDGKEFAVPTGTIADQLVLSKFPNAKFKYFNSVLDACLAVKSGKADAAAYDEPILKNIAGKNPGLVVLPEMITTDNYGFAVRLGEDKLKGVIDSVVSDLRKSGDYDKILNRWLPKKGDPAQMPKFDLDGSDGVLKFGTSAITEPFSFVDGSREVVGFDIEIASLIAKKLNKKLEIINMDFGAMIPALISNKVDIIGACITISEERAKKVLFSESYYIGGISALIKE